MYFHLLRIYSDQSTALNPRDKRITSIHSFIHSENTNVPGTVLYTRNKMVTMGKRLFSWSLLSSGRVKQKKVSKRKTVV